jgi:myo-inositol catabolism protein IolC
VNVGYERELYILAFDHRASFQRGLFGIYGRATANEGARISDAKSVIYEGFVAAVAEGAPPERAGVLVDEEFGASIAREARARGFVLAMPVEESGQDEFNFEFGQAFGEHIAEFDPTFAKVLVRYNPEGDQVLNARQAQRLALLSQWLHEQGRKYLFELLVRPTPSQLESAGGDQARFDVEVRPELMLRAIEALQDAGVEPDIWKIEGLDRREDCQSIATQARRGGRAGVGCVVLGRGADDRKVDEWLRAGAGIAGYRGFAIGRTLWWDALVDYRDGKLSREKVAERIATKYRHAIDIYSAAAIGRRAVGE